MYFNLIPIRHPCGDIKQVIVHIKLKYQETIWDEYIDLRVITIEPDEVNKGVCRQIKNRSQDNPKWRQEELCGLARLESYQRAILCCYYQALITCVCVCIFFLEPVSLQKLQPIWISESWASLKFFLRPMCGTIQSEK